MLKWRGREHERSRPFTFRGCDLTAECLPATEDVRVQFPATAPTFARYVIAGKGCRAVALAKAGFIDPSRAGYVSASPFQTSSAPACAAEFPKLNLPGAAPGRLAIFKIIWGRGRQAMHLLCKQADVGALPTDSTSLRPLILSGRRLPCRSFREGGPCTPPPRATSRRAISLRGE